MNKDMEKWVNESQNSLFIDLSHTIANGLVTYKGLTAPVICDYLRCNLHLLPDEGLLFSAIPPKFKGVGTFPVRAMAKIRSITQG
jgi:kynurenine formamidase